VLRIFANALLWKSAVRLVLFWGVVAVCIAVLPRLAFPETNWTAVFDLFRDLAGPKQQSFNLAERIARPEFAFGLASAIVQVAVAFAIAFLICHVLFVRLALRSARGVLHRASTTHDFAAQFQSIDHRLERNGLIGGAWREFSETTVPHDNRIENTIRPQAFISFADIRDRLFGLKMMGAIPGYFVGAGVLLTFIGLVIALHEATSMIGAKEADEMSPALGRLLEAATFKFSTSIAGLGASIVLALLFRSYQIWIEIGFYKFNHALERLMSFHPSQKLSLESRDILAEQRDQLKEINSDRFFSRLGDSIGSGMGTAIAEAMAPMTSRLDQAMGRFESTSQDGVAKLLQDFQNSLQGGAGVELQQMARTLDGTRAALEAVQDRLAGSGADLQRQVAEASSRLVDAIGQASASLHGSASGAAGTLESTISAVTAKIEQQIGLVAGAVSAMQATFAKNSAEVAQQSRDVGEAAAAVSRQAAEESAVATRRTVEAFQSGVGGVMETLQAELGRLVATLGRVGEQIDSVAARSRETADAFGKVAVDVRDASRPLVSHADRVAGATERMSLSMAASVSALTSTQTTASGIATQLSTQLGEMKALWTSYELRFAKVDEDLGRAVTALGTELSKQQGAIEDFVIKVDTHTESILGMLSQAVSGLGDSIDELNDTFERQRQRTE
jgi:hypothetical protein